MRNENQKAVLNEEAELLKIFLKVSSYKIGSYNLDVTSRILAGNGESKKLTTKEFLLLVIFAANANAFVDRKLALRMVWKDDSYYNSRSMDVYICKLRKLLSKDENVHIVNYHGKGYKLIVPMS